MSGAVSDLWGGVQSGLGALGRGIGSVANGIGDFVGLDGSFGLSGPTGQPMSGLPGASAAGASQGLPALPDVSSGADGAPLGAAAFAAPAIADQGGSALDQALQTMGYGSSPGTGGPLDLTSPSAPSVPLLGEVAGAAPGGGAEQPGFLGRLFGGGGEDDPLRMILPGGMLAYQIWRGSQPMEGLGDLRGLAGASGANAAAMQEMSMNAMNGRLPGSAQSAVDQALRAAQATIRSRYASLGMTGSTPEAQDLAGAEMNAVAMRFQIGQQMAQTGLQSMAGSNDLASRIYAAILQAETAQGSELGDALAAFAGATTR